MPAFPKSGGGIQSVPVGQEEAGLVLKMTKSQIFFRVKLLQMVKNHSTNVKRNLTLVKTLSRTHHCTAGDHLGRTGLYERFSGYFRTDLATVLHRHLLPYFQRYSDSGTWKLEKKLDYFR